jgi:hypothetical protein
MNTAIPKSYPYEHFLWTELTDLEIYKVTIDISLSTETGTAITTEKHGA